MLAVVAAGMATAFIAGRKLPLLAEWRREEAITHTKFFEPYNRSDQLRLAPLPPIPVDAVDGVISEYLGRPTTAWKSCRRITAPFSQLPSSGQMSGTLCIDVVISGAEWHLVATQIADRSASLLAAGRIEPGGDGGEYAMCLIPTRFHDGFLALVEHSPAYGGQYFVLYARTGSTFTEVWRVTAHLTNLMTNTWLRRIESTFSLDSIESGERDEILEIGTESANEEVVDKYTAVFRWNRKAGRYVLHSGKRPY